MTKEEQMYALLDEQADSDLTVKAFCGHRGLSRSKFHYWRARRGRRQSAAPLATPGFTPLVPRQAKPLRLELGGGLELRFAAGDLELAAELLLKMDAARAGL